MAEYDVKAQPTVNFAVGIFKISAADEEELRKLAQTTTGITRYMIEVTGYADSTGSASVNTKLSEDRAKAAITFLMQQANVPVRSYPGTQAPWERWTCSIQRDIGWAGRESSS